MPLAADTTLLVAEWLQNVWELITQLNIALLVPKAETRLAKCALRVSLCKADITSHLLLITNTATALQASPNVTLGAANMWFQHITLRPLHSGAFGTCDKQL